MFCENPFQSHHINLFHFNLLASFDYNLDGRDFLLFTNLFPCQPCHATRLYSLGFEHFVGPQDQSLASGPSDCKAEGSLMWNALPLPTIMTLTAL